MHWSQQKSSGIYWEVKEFEFDLMFRSFLSDGEGRGNPLVSGFQDDLDPDDRGLSQPAVKAAIPSMSVTLTSDEEEGDSSLHKGIGSGPNSKG